MRPRLETLLALDLGEVAQWCGWRGNAAATSYEVAGWELAATEISTRFGEQFKMGLELEVVQPKRARRARRIDRQAKPGERRPPHPRAREAVMSGRYKGWQSGDRARYLAEAGRRAGAQRQWLSGRAGVQTGPEELWYLRLGVGEAWWRAWRWQGHVPFDWEYMRGLETRALRLYELLQLLRSEGARHEMQTRPEAECGLPTVPPVAAASVTQSSGDELYGELWVSYQDLGELFPLPVVIFRNDTGEAAQGQVRRQLEPLVAGHLARGYVKSWAVRTKRGAGATAQLHPPTQADTLENERGLWLHFEFGG